MIVVEAKVTINSQYAMNSKTLMSGLRTTMKIANYGYICQLFVLSGKLITLDVDNLLEIKILYGETNIELFQENVEFEFVSGKQRIGKGYITKVKEIYVEKDALESLQDKKLAKEIILHAEKMKNALIYDDAYEVLKE